MRTVNASDFKARCLAILDDVARTGEPVVILRRGRVVAELIRPVAAAKYPQDTLIATVEFLGDVVGPVLDPETWEALSEDPA